MRISRGPLLILLLLFAIGCVPPPERRALPLLPADTLDKKIGRLESRLKEKDLSEKDREIVSTLLETYKSVKSLSTGDLTDEQYRKIIRTLFSSLALLDENCPLKEELRARDYLIPMRHFANKRREILNSYQSGDFRGVINRCLDLKTLFGPDALTPEIGRVLALSLAEEGMLREAIDIGEGVVDHPEAGPDLTLLRVGMAEWKLRLGHREEALFIYEGLQHALDEKGAAVRSLHREIISAAPAARGPVGVPGEEGPDKEAGPHRDQVLQKVDRLIREHKFDTAREILAFRRSELLLEVASPPEIETIDKALRDLDLAEEEYLKEQISLISRDYEKKETLDLARKLLEEERFEDAISRLESLDPGQEKGPEVRELRDQAIEKLINRERNRAAKLFLAAKKTHDPEKRREYLLSSYHILKGLVDTYPSSPLILKVKSHINVLREALARMGEDAS